MVWRETRAPTSAWGGFGGILGVLGYTTSTNNSARGVQGQAGGLSGKTVGVIGVSNSPNGTGVLGYGEGNSGTGSGLLGCCAVGIWGDTSSTASGAAGLVGTADNAQALYLANNSTAHLTANINNVENSTHSVEIVAFQGAFGSCSTDSDGDLHCTGTKSAVVPVDNGARHVALYAVEAPQNWFEDFGSGKLVNGVSTVALEPTFAQTVNTTDYHVFLTPRGDCQGLYVGNVTPTGFEVHELRSGQSDVAFDYRIVALRRGYEGVRLEDKTEMMARLKSGIPQR